MKLPLVIAINIAFAALSFYVGVQYESENCKQRLYEADVYYGNELYGLNLMLLDCKEKKDDEGRKHQAEPGEIPASQREEQTRDTEEERRRSLHP